MVHAGAEGRLLAEAGERPHVGRLGRTERPVDRFGHREYRRRIEDLAQDDEAVPIEGGDLVGGDRTNGESGESGHERRR